MSRPIVVVGCNSYPTVSVVEDAVVAAVLDTLATSEALSDDAAASADDCSGVSDVYSDPELSVDQARSSIEDAIFRES